MIEKLVEIKVGKISHGEINYKATSRNWIIYKQKRKQNEKKYHLNV